MTLAELEREVLALKARAAADTAFLRCALLALPTAQLRVTSQALASLAEDLSVKLLFTPDVSDAASEEFDLRKRFWLGELETEIDARSRGD